MWKSVECVWKRGALSGIKMMYWSTNTVLERLVSLLQIYLHPTFTHAMTLSTSCRVCLKPDGKPWRMGKGKLANGVDSQYSHTTTECGVSSIINTDAHTSAASSRLNWRPRWFKWTRLFRRKTKSGFCSCAIMFQTHYNVALSKLSAHSYPKSAIWPSVLLNLLSRTLFKCKERFFSFYMLTDKLGKSKRHISQLFILIALISQAHLWSWRNFQFTLDWTKGCIFPTCFGTCSTKCCLGSSR